MSETTDTVKASVLEASFPQPLWVEVRESAFPAFEETWLDAFARGLHLRKRNAAEVDAPLPGTDRVVISLRAVDDVGDWGAGEGTVVVEDDEARLSRIGTVWRWDYPPFSIRVQASRADVAVARPDADDGSADALKSTDVLRRRTLSALRQAVLVLLPRTRRPVLHGAGLCPPASRDALVLVGPTACGKSTLAAGLALRGWRCLTDDLLVLTRPGSADGRTGEDDETRQVTGLVRGIRLDPDAGRDLGLGEPRTGAQLLDPLEEGEPDEAAQKAVWDPDFAPEADARPVGTPRRLLFPELADRPESRLEEMAPADAVRRVLTQMQPPATLPPRAASDQLDAAAALVRQSRCAVLHAGRDLRDTPGRLADLLLLG